MSEGVSQPLVLRKKSRSSRFASWSGDGNRFYDKILRVFYVFLLFAIDFVMFIYSINGKLIEDGVFNQAVLFVLGGVFLFALVLILLLSFSKDLQNGVCALITMLVVVLFFHQFALFNVDTFIEEWLAKKAGWLTFIGVIPSAWLVGLILGIIIFFAFRSSFAILFITLVLTFAGLIGVKKNEHLPRFEQEYSEVKALSSKGGVRENNLIYFMLPNFPSYQFLNSVRDHNFRELRDLLVGFYVLNKFEIYPNAFVKKNDAVSNVIDIFNHVDYTSTTSGNRAYSEFINDWDFIHGGLYYFNLEENRLYDYLWENGYGISTYAMPGFNTCIKGGNFNTDRCVIKSYKTVPLYDKSKTVEQNVYALLAEWLLSLKSRELKSAAKMLAKMSPLKGLKVTAENRRVSIEGAPLVVDEVGEDFKQDRAGQVYMVYVDLPSDIYMYDEFCNLKPREEWVALKDNSFVSVGIDEKRKAYADQAKCVIGKLQEYMDIVNESYKDSKTDIIVQGVSTIRELAGMTGGRYGNFVKDQLVNLAIRKGKRPKFLINANICLASDFTKTLVKYQDYCYSIDNMNLKTDEALNLKQNLINNSVIRGSRISNIAANYQDWYAEYQQKSRSYQEKLSKLQEDAQLQKQQQALQEKSAQNDGQKRKGTKILDSNVFVPTDDLILEIDDSGEIRSVASGKRESSGLETGVVSADDPAPKNEPVAEANSEEKDESAPEARAVSAGEPAPNNEPVAEANSEAKDESAPEVEVTQEADSAPKVETTGSQNGNVAE